MAATHATKARMMPVTYLRIPETYAAAPRKKVEDDILRNSIQLTGIQQPLIVVRISDTDYWVVDGVRRLLIAQSLEIAEVPCVVDQGIDDVDDQTEYRNRIRFILDEHRQDLLPSQRAALIKKLQQSFGLKARQVALYLGVTPGTITNWTIIDRMIPEIQKAIDDEDVKIHTARAFAGMTAKGQKEIWESHRDGVIQMSGGRLHRWVRETYPPTEFRDMYEAPDVTTKQLTRKNQPRKARKRGHVSVDEKKALLKDVDARRIELEDKQAQIKEFEEHINAAIPLIEGLRKNDDLWNALPSVVRADFEEFASRYLV